MLRAEIAMTEEPGGQSAEVVEQAEGPELGQLEDLRGTLGESVQDHHRSERENERHGPSLDQAREAEDEGGDDRDPPGRVRERLGNDRTLLP